MAGVLSRAAYCPPDPFPFPMSDTLAFPKTSKIYRCGTLTYTSRHLFVLFFWLLWGTFVTC
jgi:hypothetical protein